YNLFKKKLTIILIIGLVLIIRFAALTLLGKPVPETQWDSWNYPRNIYNSYSNPNRSLRVSGTYEYLFRDIYLNVNKKIFSDNKELIEKIENYNNDRFKDYEKENEYTGYFKDKNLIMIMLESVDNWLVTKDNMPTLYKLQNEGWNFVNRYAPSFGSGSTINTEFSALTGLHSPIQGSASYNYVKNLFPFSLPNLFKNEGYVVNSLHFNYGSFYNRSNLHKALGFDNHYALIDMGFSDDVMDDRELINNDEVYKLIIPDKKQKFMTFITTYSVHGPYGENNYLCQKIFNENPEIITDDRELTCVSELSKMTDEFVQKLIERLTEDELINDTVLVIFTDHYAFGYSKVYDVKNIKDSNLIQNVPFIIWHNDIDKKIIEKIVTSSDIMPTIANLFGLTFNPNYYVGTDVFNNKHDNFVYFSDYSWYDGNIYYKGAHASAYDDPEYIIRISEKVNKKIQLNDAILNADYYRYVIKDTLK
ncbi:MAG: LTA synthase family protein, partial [Mollicutes bacterium]|nr:LTA synthase family protein [Mollicutes bacterium]